MFKKFDLSLVLAPAASQVEYENRQNAVGKFTMEKSTAPSPGRTVKTQSSSTASLENIKNSDQNSFEQSFSRTSSNKSKFSWISEKAPSLVEIFDSLRPEPNDVPPAPSPPIHRNKSPDNIKRKASDMGKNASSALKHLRKNMSLVTAMSFDSETSNNKRSRMMKKIKNTRKAFATMHHDASVMVFEAFQGFEITQNSDECDVSCTYSAESDIGNTEFGKNYEILVPRVIREMPPEASTAQRSFHFGEEKICEEDEDINKLCNLMKRTRSKSIHDNVNVASSIGRVESFDISELDEIDFRVTNETAPCRTPDCFDFMVFVNNEQEVLEYAPDDFEGYRFK